MRMTAVSSDSDLLKRYATTGAPEELTPLVERYVDLVYSAARRQLGDAHRAQDVTQQVFIVLLRKGRQLREGTVLASWLLTVTALECRNAVKSEARRSRRERKVAQMRSEAGGTGGGGAEGLVWEELTPHLDAALETLSAGDREAVVMRYFLNRSYTEAAAALGASEGSVRQRVHRGLGKLREVLAKRGVVATEAALGAALVAHAIESAPTGVSAATVAAVGNAAAAKAALSSGGLAVMSATSPVKFALVGTLLLAAVGLTAFLFKGPGNAGKVASSTSPATAPVTAMPAPVAPPNAAPVGVAAAPAPAPAAAPAPVAPPRKMFDVIGARTCDARQGTRDGYDHIGFINRGDWVEYDDVEFPPADAPRDMVFCAVLACPAQFAGGEIEVRVGSPDGPTVATLTVEATAGYSDFVCQDTPVESAVVGKQDVFLVFTGGGFNVRSIKFVVIDGRKGDEPIGASGYSMAKRVNEAGKKLVNVRNGAWARYDCLEFPAGGAETFTLNYAVDAARAGGVISVHLDLPTSKPVCEIPIVSTGGYGRFYSRTVALSKPIGGSHDVYLTFAGRDQGYQGVADVAWFSFNARRTPLTPPPPQPPAATTRATTRATTLPASIFLR
jgi:RNA polymerase sigma factor (sigma-70 family)